MRAVRTAGVGIGLVLASQWAVADAPRSRLRLAPPPVGRGQMPEATPSPPASPPGNSVQLGPARPLGQPNVTITPSQPPGTVSPLPPLYVTPTVPPQGLPSYGVPLPNQPGVLVPGQPLPHYGLTVAPEPGQLPPGAIPLGPPVGMPVQGAPPQGVSPQAVFPAPVGGLPPGAVPLGAPQPLLPLGVASALLAGPNRWEFRAETLLWWVKSQRVPVLVNTGSPEFGGITGLGNTRSIFGGDTISSSAHAGGRFGASYWLDPGHGLALDGNIFFMSANQKEFAADTLRTPFLARPFVNVNTGLPFAQIVAAPGLATGTIQVRPETNVWGAELNLRTPLVACDPCRSLDLYAGFRYFHLDDQITITETFARTPQSPTSIGTPDALSGIVRDQFRTENDFYGTQIGLRGERRRGDWTLGYNASVALGTVFHKVRADGGQLIQTTAGPRFAEGGLLALPGSNLGVRSQREFGVLPEAGLRLGYNVTPRMRLGVGYNFLYLNNVVRAGDQIDPFLDVNRIPNFPLPPELAPTATTTRPVIPLRTTDVFVQGISFSLDYTW